jgi:NADH-quinone oxidoreductase subunit N
MVIALVSLLGIPFTAGFFGKFLVFSSAIGGSILWIVVAALINSAISAFYYFNIAKAMYIENGESDKLSTTYLKSPATISTLVCTAITLVMGLVPAIYAALETASKSFGQ